MHELELFNNGKYIYEGIELTPFILSRLMLLLCNRKRFSRQQAIDIAVEYHINHGGYASRSSYIDSFKSVTYKYLSEYMENVVRNTWILNFCLDTELTEISDLIDKEKTPIEAKAENSLLADEVIGNGNESVYVFYYDTYKELASRMSYDKWPCKVGMTTSSITNRILSQSSTALPEYPHVALVIKTEDARKLETMLHNCLRYKKAETENAPGNEWFTSNPAEIKQIYLSMCA